LCIFNNLSFLSFYVSFFATKLHTYFKIRSISTNGIPSTLRDVESNTPGLYSWYMSHTTTCIIASCESAVSSFLRRRSLDFRTKWRRPCNRNSVLQQTICVFTKRHNLVICWPSKVFYDAKRRFWGSLYQP